jgi:peptide/nickel transport system substrate-binding protein
VATAQEADNSVTIVISAEPIDLDPCNVGEGAATTGIIVGQNIVETLTVLNADDGTIEPRLATSWEDRGGGVWRFKLREGVTFHDGTPFNAEAVAKALERLENEDLVCWGVVVKLGRLKLTTNVIDERTIDVSGDNPPLPIPAYLAFAGIGAPDTDPKQLVREPVGTGPYAFESWDPDGQIVLTRFDGYWGEKPEIAKATYVWRAEPSLRASMVEVGEADLALPIAPQDATDPKRDFSFLTGDTTRIRFVLQPPLDDLRVRKALNLAFDREALIGTVLSSDTIAATQFFLPKVSGYDSSLKVWPYDPEEARSLIAEAEADGVPVKQELRLVSHPGFYPNIQEVLQAMAQMWNDVGFNIRVEMLERGQFLKLANKPFDIERPAMLIHEMHDNNDGDAVFTMRFKYHSEGRHSETTDARIDELIDAADAATGDKRRDLYREVNHVVNDEMVLGVPMFHMVNYMRVGPRLDFKPMSFYSAARFELAKMRLAQ